MLSLDSDAAAEAVARFDERLRKALPDDRMSYVAEPKLDGLSVELVYEDGVLIRASTRGDGRRGEGITENVKTIRSVPLKLRTDEASAAVPETLAIRGEIVLRVDGFEALNERLMAEGKEPFANPTERGRRLAAPAGPDDHRLPAAGGLRLRRAVRFVASGADPVGDSRAAAGVGIPGQRADRTGHDPG